jgi:trehalose/maltose hydrolase-like predicted phosphorylase
LCFSNQHERRLIVPLRQRFQTVPKYANIRRFLSIVLDEVGIINYEITPLNKDTKIIYKPYIDAGVTNEDANWDDSGNLLR